jgi:hypothetical protein
MVARQSCIASPTVGFFSFCAQLLCLRETRVYGCLGDLWTRAPYVRMGTSACSGCTWIPVKSCNKFMLCHWRASTKADRRNTRPYLLYHRQ